MPKSDPGERERPEPVRQPGWVPLLGLLGIVFIMVGVVMVLMINAPVVRTRTIVIGAVMLAVGLVLLPVAWFVRRRE